jgi:hypothetical protein
MTNLPRLKSLITRLTLVVGLVLPYSVLHAQSWSTVTTADGSTPQARHESAATLFNGKIYLFGGRGERGVDVYDPVANTWESVADAPLELHHFQPVVYANKIYIIGAFTCCYPTEPTIADIHVFDPATNTWSIDGSMPAARLRGAAGTVVYQNKIYLVGGNTMGHDGGAVNWFDEYDPATGIWRVLPDAPYARDHFTAAVADGKLVVAGGRQSQRSFANTVAATDVYDFASGEWDGTAHNIPTQRAGTMATVYNNRVYVMGGESGFQADAHAEVQVFNPADGLWSQLTPMINPRHAGGSALIADDLHVFVGSDLRGASGEFSEHEKIDLSLAELTPLAGTPPLLTTQDTDADGVPDYDENNVYSTDPNRYDTDDDGINDYDEIFVTSTNPNSADTDNDGVNDNKELELNLDPNNADTDSDQISDGDEINLYNSSPSSEDTDNDGLTDGDEVLVHGSSPTDTDTDDDNLTDTFEVQTLGSDPAAADSDDDGLRDDLEHFLHGTSVLIADTDDDNIDDGTEVNTYTSDPLSEDTDGDGVIDGDEVVAGTSLTNIDEDGDGLVNSAEGLLDTDGDGLPNYADRDSDNDGIPDLIENGYSDVDRDGMLDTVEELEGAAEPATAPARELTPTTTEPAIHEAFPDHRDSKSLSLVADATEPAEANDKANVDTEVDADTAEENTDTQAIIAPTLATVALDSDNDGIPNHMDLDSDQDGISDLVESSAEFSSNVLSKGSTTDTDQDGLDDSYTALDAMHPIDSDADETPNFLDLDSNNDGVFDLVAAGGKDIDENGQLDSFSDTNNDGMADTDVPELGESLPDADNDNIPDLIDTDISGGGCSIAGGSRGRSIDPTIPATLLILIALLLRRRFSTFLSDGSKPHS